MNVAAIKAAYRRALATAQGPGEQVTIRRLGVPPTDFIVHAWITSYSGTDLVGDIVQGRRHAIVLADDLVAAGFPLPFIAKSDRMLWNGTTVVITKIDDASRRVQGTVVAYELDIEGA